jgi:TetR/AcrR family transcriptional regulator, mexJK operon transcriptional repressor
LACASIGGSRGQATDSNPKNIETTLHELSQHMLAQARMPECATLQRILAAQAIQFPELARLAHEDGWLRGIRGVAILFRQFAARGEINVDDPELAADLFLNLLLGHTTRLALHGIAIDPEFLERRRRAAVEFCSGCRARS